MTSPTGGSLSLGRLVVGLTRSGRGINFFASLTGPKVTYNWSFDYYVFV